MQKQSIAILGLILITLLVLAWYRVSRSSDNGQQPPSSSQFIKLGNITSNKMWIYLGGLTSDFNSADETARRVIIDTIGKELNFSIIAIAPKKKCAQYENKLCWLTDSDTDVKETYAYIQSTIGQKPIAGYIGFSNGGFFLNKLLQEVELNVPIITIGSIGSLKANAVVPKRPVIFILGINDTYHYNKGIDFAERLKELGASVSIVKHDGGHIIPEDALRKVLSAFVSNTPESARMSVQPVFK